MQAGTLCEQPDPECDELWFELTSPSMASGFRHSMPE